MKGFARRGMGVAAAMLLLTILLAPGTAEASKLAAGAGIYGVYGLPVVQDNVAGGPLYGAKIRADLAGPLGAEASYTSFPKGDITFKTQLGDMTTKGYSQNVLALDATLAAGPVYFLFGIGSYSLSKEHAEDINRLGYNGGIGLEFRTARGFAVDVCGRLHAMPYENGGTHKFAALQAGVNYYFIR